MNIGHKTTGHKRTIKVTMDKKNDTLLYLCLGT